MFSFLQFLSRVVHFTMSSCLDDCEIKKERIRTPLEFDDAPFGIEWRSQIWHIFELDNHGPVVGPGSRPRQASSARSRCDRGVVSVTCGAPR